jgi:hypothetical protein
MTIITLTPGDEPEEEAEADGGHVSGGGVHRRGA